MAIGFVVLLALTALVLPVGSRRMSLAGAYVARPRLARFARRQGLRITSANGDLVIRYLATTRRWRAAGLAVGLLISLIHSVPRGAVRIDFFTLFAGWFAGAVVAEWRLTTIESGGRHAAVLRRRARSDYLAPTARWLVDAAAMGAIALGCAVVVRSRTIGSFNGLAALLLGVEIAVVVVIGAVQRRVLTRAQPVANADVIAADDAIRARSLHVLAGATLALVGYLASALVIQLGNRGRPGASAVTLLIAAPLAGWLVATRASPIRRARAQAAPSAVGKQQ